VPACDLQEAPYLTVLAVNDISLSVQEPCWDLVLSRVLEDGDNSLELIGIELSGTVVADKRYSRGWCIDWRYATKKKRRANISQCSLSCSSRSHTRQSRCAPFGQIDIGLFADNVCVTSSYTLDLSEGILNLALSINVGVQKTENELEGLYSE
jgi:hypothetical protein